jgi:hypothetical protein
LFYFQNIETVLVLTPTFGFLIPHGFLFNGPDLLLPTTPYFSQCRTIPTTRCCLVSKRKTPNASPSGGSGEIHAPRRRTMRKSITNEVPVVGTGRNESQSLSRTGSSAPCRTISCTRSRGSFGGAKWRARRWSAETFTKFAGRPSCPSSSNTSGPATLAEWSGPSSFGWCKSPRTSRGPTRPGCSCGAPTTGTFGRSGRSCSRTASRRRCSCLADQATARPPSSLPASRT